jgi:hypothetical protein
LGVVTAANYYCGTLLRTLRRAYAHAEIRTLNQIYCQPAGEREFFLQRGGRGMDMRRVMRQGILGGFRAGEAEHRVGNLLEQKM